jgi:hypothetical protein
LNLKIGSEESFDQHVVIKYAKELGHLDVDDYEKEYGLPEKVNIFKFDAAEYLDKELLKKYQSRYPQI